MRFSSNTPNTIGAVCLLVLAALLCISAHAAVLSVQGDMNGASRTAATEIIDRDGDAYIALGDLAQKLSVGYRVTAGRVQLDLAGKSAWIHLDTADVDASTGPFSLSHALLREDDTVLIAASDVAPLFSNAFQVALRTQTIDAAASPAPQIPNADLVSSQPASETEVSAPQASPPVKVIVIDAGHGGTDAGAQGQDGLTEKDIDLAVAKKTKAALEAATSAQVILTRSDDTGLSILQRASIVRQAGCDLLVSIHTGASFSPRAHGVRVFCPSVPSAGEKPTFAALLDARKSVEERSRAVGDSLATLLGGVLDQTPISVQTMPLRLFSALNDVPGVLIEVGDLTNASEETLLGEDSYQDTLARGITQGIQTYIEKQNTQP